MEKDAKHQEVGDKTEQIWGFMYFSISSYCLCTVTTVWSLASLSPNPQSRARRRHRSEEGEERKAGEGIYVLCSHGV